MQIYRLRINKNSCIGCNFHMPVKRVVSIKNTFLQTIRNNFRLIFINATATELGVIHSKQRDLLKDNKGNHISVSQLSKGTLRLYKELDNQWWVLERALRRSILKCSLCGSSTEDMIFNHEKSEWFCEVCNLRLIE